MPASSNVGDVVRLKSNHDWSACIGIVTRVSAWSVTVSLEIPEMGETSTRAEYDQFDIIGRLPEPTPVANAVKQLGVNQTMHIETLPGRLVRDVRKTSDHTVIHFDGHVDLYLHHDTGESQLIQHVHSKGVQP